MKYVSLAILFSLASSQVFALAEQALEESQSGIEVEKDPTLKLKANLEQYLEKTPQDPKKKIFVKKNVAPNNINLSASKDKGSELDVYHIDWKEGEKIEKLIVFDKTANDEKIIKKVVKCKRKCQTFNKNFCEKLIEKHQRINSLSANDTNSPAVNEIKRVYEEQGVHQMDMDLFSKIDSLAKESIEESQVRVPANTMAEINSKLPAHPIMRDFKKKFGEDLRECYNLRASFKPNAVNNSPAANTASANAE